MLFYRIVLSLGISIVTLLISIILDLLLEPLPLIAQFLIHIPIIVIIVDEGRRWLLDNMKSLHHTLTEEDINGCFFFAAPMATVGAISLFKSLAQFRL